MSMMFLNDVFCRHCIKLFLFLAMVGVAGCDHYEFDDDWGKSQSRPIINHAHRQTPIRVFLLEADQIQIRGDEGFYSIWDVSNNRKLFDTAPGQKWQLRRSNNRWYLEESFGKSLLTDDNVAAEAVIEAKSYQDGIVSLGNENLTSYRGNLRFLSVSPGRFAVINIIDIDDYLQGVVGSEMPAYWYKAALRAQSIAARTYALYQMSNKTDKNAWDIGSDQSSQVYLGRTNESPRTIEAVRGTAGLVLAYGLKGREKIFPTFYSAVCGGHTQDAEPTFGLSLAPLKGRLCNYCKSVAKPKRYRWPSVTIAKHKASELLIERFPNLAQLERVVDIKIIAKSDYGRNERVELLGSNGKRNQIRGEELRLALSTKEKPLLSSWFKLVDAGNAWRFEDGHGWGHGVGMCQCGCQQLAKIGKDCVDILQYYYPQAVLLRAY